MSINDIQIADANAQNYALDKCAIPADFARTERRREFLTCPISHGETSPIFPRAAIVGSALLPRRATAAIFEQNSTGAGTVDIQRIGILEPIGDIPIISLASVHDNIVHLCGITADPAKLGDIKDQTKQTLDRIDRLLDKAGTSKSKLLSAQVWLTDMAHFADHNSVWNAWVDAKNPPVRMCVQSPQLWRPGLLVEIMVTAAR